MEPLGKKALKGQKFRIVFEIIQQDAPAILGCIACQRLGMVKRLYKVEQNTDILNDFDDLFAGLGCLPEEHNIQTDI